MEEVINHNPHCSRQQCITINHQWHAALNIAKILTLNFLALINGISTFLIRVL